MISSPANHGAQADTGAPHPGGEELSRVEVDCPEGRRGPELADKEEKC